MLNEDEIDMVEFEALRNIQHVDKSNRNRFINFYKMHIDSDPKGTKTCRTCWDRMRARRDDVHRAWDDNHLRLQAIRSSMEEQIASAHDELNAAKAKLEDAASRAVQAYKSDPTKAYTNTKNEDEQTQDPS